MQLGSFRCFGIFMTAVVVCFLTGYYVGKTISKAEYIELIDELEAKNQTLRSDLTTTKGKLQRQHADFLVKCPGQEEYEQIKTNVFAIIDEQKKEIETLKRNMLADAWVRMVLQIDQHTRFESCQDELEYYKNRVNAVLKGESENERTSTTQESGKTGRETEARRHSEDTQGE